MQYIPWIVWVITILIGAILVQRLTDAISALNVAITALQGRVAGSVPVAQVEAAADQINAAVATLNSIGV